MRLLTEYMPVQAIDVAALSTSARAPKPEVPAVKVQEAVLPETEPAENRNMQLAREIDKHKTDLIQILSRFPGVAHWLLEKYDSSVQPDDSEEDGASSSLSDDLKLVKECFQVFVSCTHERHEQDEFETSRAKRELEASVSAFPFSFNDLKTLVEMILSAAGNEGEPDFHIKNSDSKSREIIRKRLIRVHENDDIKPHDPAPDTDKNEMLVSALLPGRELNTLINRMILAEHYWLFFRQQLATVNTKLVLFIANQYKGSFLDFEDLVQEGQSGLLKAVDRFKYQLGFQFSTYAGYWIRQAISRALSRSERVVRIPCGQIAAINRVFRAKDEILLKTGKEPTVQELAEYTGLRDEEIHNFIAISQSSVPLEAFEDEEDENAFAPIDFIEQQTFAHCSDRIAEGQLGNLVRTAVKALNTREEKIISSHFGMDADEQKTLQQIGRELNLTRERVRQIQVVALKKIRHRYGEQLSSFL